jgi:uncharacterized protein (DUF885 family)
MKKVVFFVLITGLLVACGSSHSTNQNAVFNQYKSAFVLRLWKQYPGWASSQGFHQYDSVLVVPTAKARLEEKAFVQAEMKALEQFNSTELSPENALDLGLIRNQLESTLWQIDTFKSYEWDPSGYNVCGSFAELLNQSNGTKEQRLRAISFRLRNVPAYYEAAKASLHRPTKEHTLLAINQNRGGAVVFEVDIPVAVAQSNLTQDEKDELIANCKRAFNAVNDYADWLAKNPFDGHRSFRIGAKLYAQKFKFDIQSQYTAQELYQRALRHKKELHHQMVALSQQLWLKYMGTAQKPSDSLQLVRELLDKLSLNHTTPENFQQEISDQIPTLTAFVQQHNLIYIDPKKPLEVRKEPAYMAGVAGASISAPGPYDKNGKTYYNVGSMSGWTAEQSESYLREYNDYILQILNIHEAIPGHYTQLVYSNKAPSIIKAILGNGSMIEGWAVYTERMMLENGYGNQSPEMWLMYYKWNLRTTCNTILDYSVHQLDMSKERAIDLLTREAFQQTAEAEGKWKRATLTQVQLCSYFNGFSEIMDFRSEMKRLKGKSFHLKQFHESFLSYGSAPVKEIRKIMMAKEHR